MGTNAKAHLLSAPLRDVETLLESRERARHPWRHWQKGENPFGPNSQLGRKSRLKLQSHYDCRTPEVVTHQVSPCGTHKLLLETQYGNKIETVLIPVKSRTTLCISSQVGCARGCRFCVTATMGLRKNLRAEEILGQVLIGLQKQTEQNLAPLRNIVFMGMGEPLDNLREVHRTIDQLTDPRTLGFSKRFITLSTVGPSPYKISQLRNVGAQLAWSLHAVEPQLRKKLIPTAHHSPEELRESFIKILTNNHEGLLIEMTLIAGLNDRAIDASRLADFLKPLPGTTRINLIPMNPGRVGLEPTTALRLQNYGKILKAAGYRTLIRTERGSSANAACGQLQAQNEKRAL